MGAIGACIMRRTIAATVSVLVAASLLAPVAGAGTSHVNTVSNATANEAHWMNAFDAMTTALGDFNGDGKPELVGHNDDQYVYVMSTTSPHIYAEFRPDYPSGWGVRPLNDPVVVDVDGNGRLDIVVVTSAAGVCRYEYNPSGSTSTSFAFDKRWCHRMTHYDGSGAAADGGAWVEDVDYDGRMEIFAQTEELGLYAYNHDGSIRWRTGDWGGNGGPVVADLDGDGAKEVVFFSDGGTVRAFRASTGAQKWVFSSSAYVWPASIPVAGNAGDVDGDGKKEVVFVARDAHDANNYDNNHFMLFVLNAWGGLKWRASPSWGNPMSYTHPALVDVSGDGVRDIVLQDWNTIGHKPGNWEPLGPANVFAYNGWGTLLWRQELSNTWSNDDLAIGDVDGDGAQEVLAIGFGPSGDGVWYLDARTGAKEAHVGVGSDWTALRGPIIGDMDGSGKLSWAISIHDSDMGGAYKVFRTDAACNSAWPGWQNHYGCTRGATGTGGTGGGSTPPPSGDFDASFRTNGGNQWWVEVYVDANQALAKVEARADGGSWHTLTKRSWGAWAASFHVPDGSVVEFRATSTSGATDTSGGYRWPSGTPTSDTGGGTGGGDTGGTFSASFTPKSGNEWWIQVDVDSSQTVSGVDVRINGGSWRTLEKKSWGDWAGSYHAPEGSTVQFRAKSSGGDTALSGCYRWTSATSVSCDGGSTGGDTGGGTSGFDATFSNARGNEWWVEVNVKATESVSAVHARVNGGDWRPLEKTSWGSWADNIHAPSGSTVEFRATGSSGATDTSGTYRWPPS